jgi:hypothetical protein
MEQSSLSTATLALILLLGVWSIPWKGVALWKAVKNGNKKWFIVMFLINTVAILEIIYIFYFSKKKSFSAQVTVQK